MAEGHVWQGGMHDRGHVWQGACMSGACMAGGMHDQGVACVAGEMVTASVSTHPYLNAFLYTLFLQCFWILKMADRLPRGRKNALLPAL